MKITVIDVNLSVESEAEAGQRQLMMMSLPTAMIWILIRMIVYQMKEKEFLLPHKPSACQVQLMYLSVFLLN